MRGPLPNESTRGRASGMARVRPIAPMMPPAIDERKARLNARFACPFLAIAYPSSMVTDADADPGAPSNTAETVSEVWTTAKAPMRSAKAEAGSIPKVMGRRIATAAVPPRPGMRPITRPEMTPINNMSNMLGSASEANAAIAESNIVFPS